jgi:hypothetical protein
VLTLVQTRKAEAMPVVLFGREYWEEVLNLPLLARRGLISEGDLNLFRVVDSVDEAYEHLTKALN